MSNIQNLYQEVINKVDDFLKTEFVPSLNTDDCCNDKYIDYYLIMGFYSNEDINKYLEQCRNVLAEKDFNKLIKMLLYYSKKKICSIIL